MSGPGIKPAGRSVVGKVLRLATGWLAVAVVAVGCSLQAEWLYRRAVDAEVARNYPSARKDFSRLAQDFPDSPRAAEAQWRAARILWMEEKQGEAAQLLYRELIRDFADSPYAVTGTLELMQLFSADRDKHLDGLKLAESFEDQFPQSPHLFTVRMVRHRLLAENQRYEEALMLMRGYVEGAVAPERGKYVLEYARTLYVVGDLVNLLHLTTTELLSPGGLSPEIVAELQLLQSIAYEENRDLDKAISILHTIIDHPNPRVIADRIVALQERKLKEGYRER